MERTEFLKLGAYCLQRMSLQGQKQVFSLAGMYLSFNEAVVGELGLIDKGEKFIAACKAKLGVGEFMDILAYCDQATIDRIIVNNELKRQFLNSQELGGHKVLENEAIHYTNDMENTVRWFGKVLGWPGMIEVKDDLGQGIYGLIVPRFEAYSAMNRDPYLQLMRGEPRKTVSAFIKIWGLDGLRHRILDSGWIEATSIEETTWGARIFVLTTCDGSLIRFYEPNEISA